MSRDSIATVGMVNHGLLEDLVVSAFIICPSVPAMDLSSSNGTRSPYHSSMSMLDTSRNDCSKEAKVIDGKESTPRYPFGMIVKEKTKASYVVIY
mmetsp:Transcript_14508/g.27206  ORF Transcript_14508/g.27206 Transcript_14508/m.27206 type:complete len:95 (+) Transcript_14508:326-610(+)